MGRRNLGDEDLNCNLSSVEFNFILAQVYKYSSRESKTVQLLTLLMYTEIKSEIREDTIGFETFWGKNAHNRKFDHK